MDSLFSRSFLFKPQLKLSESLRNGCPSLSEFVGKCLRKCRILRLHNVNVDLLPKLLCKEPDKQVAAMVDVIDHYAGNGSQIPTAPETPPFPFRDII